MADKFDVIARGVAVECGVLPGSRTAEKVVPRIADAVRAAVLAERERCAGLVDVLGKKHGEPAWYIAAAIRSTAPDETPPAAGRTET